MRTSAGDGPSSADPPAERTDEALIRRLDQDGRLDREAEVAAGDRKVFLVIGTILGGGSALSLATLAWRARDPGLPFAIVFGSFLAFSSVVLGVWGLVKYWRLGSTLERIEVEREALWTPPPDDP